MHISNIRQLKVELAREVSTLRQLAEERQKTWEDTCQKFGEKVDTLERQLSVSKQEASLDALTRIANRGTFDRTCIDPGA